MLLRVHIGLGPRYINFFFYRVDYNVSYNKKDIIRKLNTSAVMENFLCFENILQYSSTEGKMRNEERSKLPVYILTSIAMGCFKI